MPPIHWLLLCLRVIVVQTGFVHGHQSGQENHLDHAEKFQNLLRCVEPLASLTHVQAFRDRLHGELPHIHIFRKDRPNPLT